MNKQNAVYTSNGMLSLKKGYSAVYTAVWMNLEDFMRSEISQSQKEK